MFAQVPRPEQLDQVGPAQQPINDVDEDKIKKHRKLCSRVEKGVYKILSGPRAMVIPQTSQADLMTCLKLMKCETPLPFHWNTSLYVNPPELKEPRVPSADCGKLEGDDKEPQVSDEDEDDDAKRPEWIKGEVHLLATEAPPWWAVARFVYVCLLVLHKCRKKQKQGVDGKKQSKEGAGVERKLKTVC